MMLGYAFYNSGGNLSQAAPVRHLTRMALPVAGLHPMTRGHFAQRPLAVYDKGGAVRKWPLVLP